MSSRDHEFLETVLWVTRAVVRHLKLSLLLVATLTLVAVIGTGLIDEKFEATALILPPLSDAAGMQRVAAEMGSISKLLGGSFSDSRDADVLEALLLSTELHKEMADQFQLATLYKLDKNPKKPAKTADILKVFRKQFEVEFNESDFLELSYRDKSPERAKELLESLLDRVDTLYSRVQAEEARNSREYYTRRVIQARATVDSLQRTMVEFQQKHGVIDPEIQYEETVKMLSEAMRDQEQAASELSMERKERGENTLRYSQLKNRYTTTSQTVSQLKKRRDSVLLPLADAPALIQSFASLKLDLELQMKVLEGLQLQVELAQLHEKSGSAKFIVLERPWLNDKKVAPPRMAIVLVTFTIALVLATLIAAVLEFIGDQRESNGRFYHLLRTTREAFRRHRR